MLSFENAEESVRCARSLEHSLLMATVHLSRLHSRHEYANGKHNRSMFIQNKSNYCLRMFSLENDSLCFLFIFALCPISK